jgi:hypothetical protein
MMRRWFWTFWSALGYLAVGCGVILAPMRDEH